MVCKTAGKEARNMYEEGQETPERPGWAGGDVDDYIFKTEQDWLISDR